MTVTILLHLHIDNLIKTLCTYKEFLSNNTTVSITSHHIRRTYAITLDNRNESVVRYYDKNDTEIKIKHKNETVKNCFYKLISFACSFSIFYISFTLRPRDLRAYILSRHFCLLLATILV